MSKLFTVTERVQVGLEIRENATCSIPLNQGLLRLVKRESEGMRSPATRLLSADLVSHADAKGGTQFRWITEKDARDRRAIVCVHTGCSKDVETTLLACTKQEEVLERQPRVVRKFRPFEEAAGCTLLQELEYKGADDQPFAREYLIEMLPGAAFILFRAGSLETDVPTILTIRWEGRWDMRGVTSPADALEAHRYGLFVHSERRNKVSYIPPAITPSFQAR